MVDTSSRAFTLAIPFLGSLSSVFGFVPLSALQMGSIIAVVAGYIAATEAAKLWIFRLENPAPPASRELPGPEKR